MGFAQMNAERTRSVKRPCHASKCPPLSGIAEVPGDKSISHRSLLLALLAHGTTRVYGLLEGEDVLATAAAVRQLGASVQKEAAGHWRVDGIGLGRLKEPDGVIDMGNSGTGARLLIGLLSTHPLRAVLTGDESLRSRPMARVTRPLATTGATFEMQGGERLPLTMVGSDRGVALTHRLEVASAQVKSAVLLAALNLPGQSVVKDPFGTRDHTENMLKHFGADIAVTALEAGGTRIALAGRPQLQASAVHVPADPSSAAFPIVAALLVPGSSLTVPGVCLNPTRAGLFGALKAMGANIILVNERLEAGERVADLQVSYSALNAITLDADIVPSMVDEFPILAIAAANAVGTSRFKGLEELRVKESDRLSAIHQGLKSVSVAAHIEGDDLIVEGCGPGGVTGGNQGGPVTTHFDHRIAMSFLVAGLASKQPVYVDDSRAIATSFPTFFSLFEKLGGWIKG